MDVSVVIINYNTFHLTSVCIESIIEKTEDISYEIILVDNGSTECEAVLFKTRFPEIKLIESNLNLGFSKGNNLGLSHAIGNTLILLNSDTVLINNALKIAHNLLIRDPSVGVLCGQLLNMNYIVQPAAGRFPSLKRELLELLRIPHFFDKEKKARYYLHKHADYSRPLEADWVSGAFFVFSKDILKSFPNHKLHENFFMYYEDVQWCYHIRRRLKKKVIYDPRPQIHHIEAASSSTTNQILKNFKVIVPNQYKWMLLEKGPVYTKIFYVIRSLHYFSLRDSHSIRKALIFFLLSLHGIDYYENRLPIEQILNPANRAIVHD